MTKLEQLITELCPDGVPFTEINSVCKTLPPRIKVKSNDYLREGLYPVIDQGRDFIGGYTNEEGAFPKDQYQYLFPQEVCRRKRC